MNQRPVIVLAESSDPAPIAWLKERADVLERSVRMHGAAYTKVNGLDRAPKKVVGRGGVGLDRRPRMPPARRAGGLHARCQYPGRRRFCLRISPAIASPWEFFRDKAYPPKEFKRIRDTVRGRQLNELTIGILGMGRVGRRVGHIAANGFGMRVIYNDLLNVAGQLDFPATSVDKSTLFRDSDILTIHIDMRPGNENLIGPKEIAQLKPTTVLINTSRGEVLDVHALAEALRAKKLFAAALDVFAPEPPAEDFPLLGLPNVLLTPHLAARTTTAMENMSWVVRDLIEILEGRAPKYPAPVA
jgi:lactate dehydrogenase-like 2-hydroxyacid dehydrogenase